MPGTIYEVRSCAKRASEASAREYGVSGRRFQRGECLRGLALREAGGVVESAGRFDGFDDRPQLREPTLLDGQANERALLIVAMAQGMQQRQRGFAFGEIVAEILAARGRIRAVVEHVVDELVGDTKMFAVACERFLLLDGRAGQYGGYLRTGFEQPAGLAVDDLEVSLLGGFRIVRIHELQHFAFGDHVGGVRHDLHDALRADGGHHLKRA